MFEIEYKSDCSGKEVAILKLKQGDTGTLKVNPKSKSTGEKIDFALLSKIEFKFGYDGYKTLYTKELERSGEFFLLRIDSEESEKIDADSYKYEIDCTFIDGTKDTPREGKIVIKEELK